MTPLRLVMRAFGPYAEEQVVDFGDLGDRSLFLITGATGSGKSTVLDAIAFALFGESSGAERIGKQMRSDYAPVDLLTEVEMDFSCGDDRWRVVRRPEQERPAKRGGGTTTERTTATLWRLSEDGSTDLVAEKLSEVNVEIERRLGFDADQFRQVVVLPQGRFRELLSAGSDERERLLETLFGTEIYARVERSLKERRSVLSRSHALATEKRATLLGETGDDNEESFVERIAEIGREIGALDKNLEAARVGVSETRTALDTAKALDLAFERDRSLKEEAGALEKARPQMEETRAALADARRARRVSPAFEARKTAAENLSSAQKRLGEAEEEREAADAKATTAATEAKAQRAGEKALREDQAELRVLQRAAPALDEISKLRGGIAKLTTAFDDACGAANMTEGREVQNLLAQKGAREKELANAQARAQNTDALRSLVAAARSRCEDRGRLEQLQAAVVSQTTELDRCREAFRMATDASDSAAKALREGENQARAASASMLAAGLEDDAPCPVCGSVDHPSPASSDPDAPDEARLERLRALSDRAVDACTTAKEAETQAATAAASLAAQSDEIARRLGDAALAPREALDRALTEAEAEVSEADKASASVVRLEAQIAEITEDLDESIQAKEEAEQKRDQTKVELDAAAVRLDTLVEQLPTALLDLADPAALLAAQEADLSRREAKLRAAVEADQAARTLAAETAASAKAAREQADRARSTSRDAEDALKAALEANEFTNEAAFVSACVSDAEIDNFEARLKDFDRDSERVAREAAEVAATLADKTRPDLDDLTNQHQAAAQLLEEITSRRGALLNQQTTTEKLLGRLRDATIELEKIEKEFAVVGRVSDVAAGRAPNAAGMPLQRFVLAALLDDVLAAASERLRVMTNARYLLSRSLERGSRRSTTGLKLEVEDSYTGTSRSVETLSGGESFMAALALALGLADAVERYAGGIRLGAVFIDEGFGSLDGEALDLAMRALEDLRAGGRLVGIISHVSELKERVTTRLEVTAGRSGSHAKFVLG